ncbi:helix-turn-helix domain-containing protein [Thermomonospora amylolytica]|uniref:helix-turn-helix domain-containing protein n=1 Tax=Thermomonospora amylolytica TaxID=1411117 RepID=UPI000E6B9E53|nr:helix-turn-helix transcriptional regulator [Thermomonospora amylolytica]
MATSRAPSVRRRRLGAELRRLREERDLTGDGVAESLGWSPSKVSRIENARIGARVEDVRAMLDLYRVAGAHRDAMLTLAEEATRPGWWSQYPDLPIDFATYIALEDEATAALQVESMAVPGLLQTRDYARYVMRSWNFITTTPPQQIERRVEVRMRRQQLLTRADPLRLEIVLDESVLQRMVGDRAVMRAQLDHLHTMAQLPHVVVRILPLAGPHPILANSFTLLEFAPVHDVIFPDIVHTESLTMSSLTDESVTYMYRLAHETLMQRALGRTDSLQRIRTVRDQW